VPREHPAFGLLRRGDMEVVLVGENGKLLAANRYSLASRGDAVSDEFRKSWTRVDEDKPLLPDAAASYWDVIGESGHLEHRLSPVERLSLGWARRCRDLVRFLDHLVQSWLPKCREELGTYSPNNDAERQLLQVLMAPDSSVSSIVTRYRELVDVTAADVSKWLIAVSSLSEFIESRVGSAEAAELPVCPMHLVTADARLTACGQRLAYLEKLTGQLKLLELQPNNFPKTFDAKEYWERLRGTLPFNWGMLVSGHDVPYKPHNAVDWPLAEDAKTANESADALLAEAVALKRWSIPPGAIVELPLGPFTRLQAWEVEGEYFFVARTPSGEFSIANCEPDKSFIGFCALELERADPDAERKWSAVRMLIAALVRDFVVVEERETVFGARSEKRPPRWLPRNASNEPVVVYLPRVRYKPNLDVTSCAATLEHATRRAHSVGAHLRRSESSSAGQQFLARRYGFTIPKGYTFVRAHERGHLAREVIYRSRSALRALFTAVETKPSQPVEWFAFERDVLNLMEKLGFDVQHVAASKRGDHGVDVYATKGANLDEVSWVIQCKCYRLDRKVGPSIVRELVGTLAEYPRGTRGMVVTTSDFTTEARLTAQRAEIRLMAGEEFLQLTHSPDDR